MAMAELRNVAQQRDKALTERDAARAGYSAMSRRIYGPGGECFELDKARAEIAVANDRMLSLGIALDMERINARHASNERDTARQSLRAAEADLAETESVNSDLRTVNARLVADLADAMERLNHAESIIMQ